MRVNFTARMTAQNQYNYLDKIQKCGNPEHFEDVLPYLKSKKSFYKYSPECDYWFKEHLADKAFYTILEISRPEHVKKLRKVNKKAFKVFEPEVRKLHQDRIEDLAKHLEKLDITA